MAYPVALSENHSVYFNAAHLPEANGASTRKTVMVGLAAFALIGASISLYAGGWMVAAPIAIITVFSVGVTVFAVSVIALAALGYVHRSEYQKRQKAFLEFATLGFVAYRAQYVPKTISESELKVFVNEEALKATSFSAFINQHSDEALGYLESGPKGHLKTLLMNEMNGLETTALITFAVPVEFSNDAEIMSVRYQLLVSRFSSLNLSSLEVTQRQQLIYCVAQVYNDADRANSKIKLFSSYGPDKVLDLYRDYEGLFSSGFFKGEDLFIGSKITLQGAFDTACAPLSASQILEFGKELFTQRFLTPTVALSNKLNAYIVDNASNFLKIDSHVVENYASTGLTTLLAQSRAVYQEYVRVCKSDINRFEREHDLSLSELEKFYVGQISKKLESLQLKDKKHSYDRIALTEGMLRQTLDVCIAQQNRLEREGLFRLAIPEQEEIRTLQSEVSGQSPLSPREIELRRSRILFLLEKLEPLVLKFGQFITPAQFANRREIIQLKEEREIKEAILKKKATGFYEALSLTPEQRKAKERIAEIDRRLGILRKMIANVPFGSSWAQVGVDEARAEVTSLRDRIFSLEKEIDANKVLLEKLEVLERLQARKKAIEDAIAKKAELEEKLPDLRTKLEEAQATLAQAKNIYDLAELEYQRFHKADTFLFERSKAEALLDLENLKKERQAAHSRDVEALTVEFKRKATSCLEVASVGSYPAPSAPSEASAEVREDNPTIVE